MSELENASPETAEEPTNDPIERSTSLEELAAALGTETPEGDEPTGNGDAGEKPKKAKLSDLKGLAEQLGVEVKDLYGIKIPSAKEGESFTLGELKDEMQKRSDFTVRELQWEEDRQAKQAEFSRAEGELRELLSALPVEALNPQVVEAARRKFADHVKAEQAKTLEAIPEWRDTARFDADMAEMAEHLAGYGFAPNYLATVNDARTLRYIRDNHLREKRVRAALASVTEKKTPGLGKSRSRGANPKSDTDSTIKALLSTR